jgi:hypothetical protein
VSENEEAPVVLHHAQHIHIFGEVLRHELGALPRALLQRLQLLLLALPLSSQPRRIEAVRQVVGGREREAWSCMCVRERTHARLRK